MQIIESLQRPAFFKICVVGAHDLSPENDLSRFSRQSFREKAKRIFAATGAKR
jgi:hypothetical protein